MDRHSHRLRIQESKALRDAWDVKSKYRQVVSVVCNREQAAPAFSTK